MNDNFYILSIDGGGYRGIFAAHILAKMEDQFGIQWKGTFKLFAGTSTGSILAAGLACGLRAEALLDFYKDHGNIIFKPRKRALVDPFKLFTSRYSSVELKKLLDEKLGETLLGQVTSPLIIPSVDISNGKVHVLKSRYDQGFCRDPKVRVSDAVLASCSAPTYFDPRIVDSYELVDGGLWANNPSMVAAIDANYRLGIPFENIRVLSIGTGTSRQFYPRSEVPRWTRVWKWLQGWGLMTRWQSGKLVDLILELQSQNAHSSLCLMLGQNPMHATSVLRLNFESDTYLPMDKTSKGDDWIAHADHCFTHHADDIKAFLNLK
ncbi:CBASS cGAMP-activated phospholipase [Stieleria varia]|uniref:Patatin-like phospholipase n=1 Tax=Stieleria varia TaxID=2528005 RepID=A0A5C6AE23_9BACT|nr:CBASS cGAMP-activated phospholipase [Stieleria varia]TWT98224.1 Patatin-like phospholipase [Stieleria varia]